MDREKERNPEETVLRERILALLYQRGPGKSICPSEVARAVAPESWRPLMEPGRQVARQLAREGIIRITRKERTLDPDGEWKGAVRLRFP